jgi:hypothetical protein
MNQPTVLPKRSLRRKALSYAEFTPVAATSLGQLKQLIAFYTSRPIRDGDLVAGFFADKQMLIALAADINEHFHLGKIGLRPGEIKSSWSVFYLASFIDLLREKAGQ